MSVNNIRMGLDFLFNATPALDSLKQLGTGFKDTQASINAISDKIGNLRVGLNVTATDIKNIASSAGAASSASIRELGLSHGIAISKLDELVAANDAVLQSVYNSQKAILGNVRGISEEVQQNVAAMRVDDFAMKTSVAVDQAAKAMQAAGVTMQSTGQQWQMVLQGIGAESEKSLNKFNDVMAESSNLMKTANPTQMAQYQQLMYQLDARLASLQQEYAETEMSAEEYHLRAQELAEDHAASLKHLNYQVDFTNNKMQQMKRSLGNLFSGTTAGFMSTLAAVSILDDALRSQQQTVATTHQLAMMNRDMISGLSDSAQGFNRTVMQMNSSIRSIGGETQVSMTRASEAFNAIASARVRGTIDELEQMTVTSVRMQQAFGISEGAAADLFRTLNLAGGLDAEGINAVGEALADVQAVWGLTGEEATEASAQIGRVINRMTAMGANSIKNAGIVAREVGRMTTAFTRAGLSAQDASAMMDRFMDPSKIEDNVLLWNSMGMSVSDGLAMMTGDAAAMEGMTERLMHTARDLKEQYGDNPLALQAMAEAHGLTIQQVNQLASELEAEQALLSDPAAMRAMEQRANLEEQANQARASAAEAIQRLAALGNVLMQSFIMPMIDFLTPLISGLASFTSKVFGAIDALGPLGGVIKSALGAFLLFTVVTRGNIFKLLGPIKMLTGGKGFGGLFSAIKGGAASATQSIGRFVSSAADKLGKGGPLSKAIGNLGQRMQGLGGNTPANLPDNATPPGGGPDVDGSKPNKFMEGISKLPAKQLMMVGAAMLMVAGAVALLALSFKILVETVQNASFGEIAAAVGLLVVMMGLLIGMMWALQATVPAMLTAGSGLLFFGGALMMIAAAVAIVVLSMSVLLNTLKGMTGPEILGGIAMLAIVMGGFILMILALGAIAPVLYTAGTGLLFFGAGLMLVAGAMVLFGLGIMMIGVGLKMITETINNAGEAFVENAGAFAAGILAILPALAALGAVAIIASLGIVPLSIGLALILVTVLALGGAFMLVGDGIRQMTEQMIYIGQNMWDVIKGFVAFAAGLALVGAVAVAFGIPLILAGAAILALGIGMQVAAGAIARLAEISDQILPVFAALAAGLTMLAIVGLFAIGPLVGMGVALLAVGVGMMMAGLGIQLVAKGLMTLSEISGSIIGISIQLAIGLTILAAAGSYAAIPLAILGGAMLALGLGLALAGVGINAVAFGFGKLIELQGQMIPAALELGAALGIMALGMVALALAAPYAASALLALVVMIPILLVMNWALGGIANKFERMGEGISLFAQNIGTAISGIQNLKSELSDVGGLAGDFLNELGMVNAELQNFTGATEMALAAQQNLTQSVTVERDEEDNPQLTVLSDIATNTFNTNATLERIENWLKEGGTGRQTGTRDIGMGNALPG